MLKHNLLPRFISPPLRPPSPNAGEQAGGPDAQQQQARRFRHGLDAHRKLLPKLLSRIVRSLTSTLPSPLRSPWLQVIPVVWPKCHSTTVKLFTSTLPSQLTLPAPATLIVPPCWVQPVNSTGVPLVLRPL